MSTIHISQNAGKILIQRWGSSDAMVSDKLTNKDLSPNFTPALPLIHPFQVSTVRRRAEDGF